MKIATSFQRNGTNVEIGTNDGVILIPNDTFIAVNDTSGFVSIKLTATRKTLCLVPEGLYNE